MYYLWVIFKKIYLAVLSLSCGTWDLAPRLGIKPILPCMGAQSLSHWTSTAVPILDFNNTYFHACLIINLFSGSCYDIMFFK